MRINGHAFKPRKTRFLGGGKAAYHLGLELEMEAPDYGVLHNGVGLRRAGVMYAKHDGSLSSYGVELVTHPIAMEAWLKRTGSGPVKTFLTYVSQLREMGFTSHSNARCGLHVHVSRKALRDRVHLYWLGQLVNGGLFATLSQRTSGRDSDPFHYCQQAEFKVQHAKKPYENRIGTRYAALNLENRHTVEVRIFRGNMREERIRKAVEAVVAAVEFTRTLTSRDFRLNLTVAFRDYVVRNRETYPNLHSFLFSDRSENQCA
jgi:hypothetical protein